MLYFISEKPFYFGKPVYYYTGKIGLKSENFSNVGQAILINCNNSRISNLNISYSGGIILSYSNNNTIFGCNISYNQAAGIDLDESCSFNNISWNIITNNQRSGINLYKNCNYNNN